MNGSDVSSQMTWVIRLLTLNLVALIIGAGTLIFGFLPKIERAIQATERVESRFQDFADNVEPVLTAGAGKAIQTIQGMNAEQLSETATENVDSLLDAATEHAKRFLEKNKTDANKTAE